MFERFFQWLRSTHFEEHPLEKLHPQLSAAVEAACAELESLNKDAALGLLVKLSPPLSRMDYLLDPALPCDAEITSGAVRASVYNAAIVVQKLVRQGKFFHPRTGARAIPGWADFAVLVKKRGAKPKFFFASPKGVSHIIEKERPGAQTSSNVEASALFWFSAA